MEETTTTPNKNKQNRWIEWERTEGRKIAPNALYTVCAWWIDAWEPHSIGLSINHLHWVRRVRNFFHPLRFPNANAYDFKSRLFFRPFLWNRSNGFSVRLTVQISGQPIHTHTTESTAVNRCVFLLCSETKIRFTLNIHRLVSIFICFIFPCCCFDRILFVLVLQASIDSPREKKRSTKQINALFAVELEEDEEEEEDEEN